MAQFTNTFSQGMDKDSSKNKYDNVHYFEAENFRVVTQNGLSSGGLENVLGNLRRVYTTVSGVDNFVVNGVVLRDHVILWTTTRDASTPDPNSVDRIWKVPIATIDALSGTDFLTLNAGWFHSNPATNHLIYSGNLNLCTGNKIRAVARYESSTIQKVYWIDGYNNLRHLNTVYNANTNDLTTLTLDKLEVISNFSVTRPEFVSMKSGNLRSGKVQYVYQLYTLNGGETVFSPASHLINIVEANDLASTTADYMGSGLDVNTGKAVVGSIEVTALGYHRIRIVAIHYSTLEGDPTVRVIEERDVSSAGETITFVDSGQSLMNYTLEDVRLYGTYTFIPKEIVVKDNILLPANIKENSFDVDFDARAYRFAGAGAVDDQDSTPNYQASAALRRKCKIYDQDGAYYLGDGTNPTGTWAYYNSAGVAVPANNITSWVNIPETFDCINKFNDIDNDGLHAHRFMYQKDGATLGGEGPHVRYTFRVKTIELDNDSAIGTILTTLENTADNPSYFNYASPYQCAKYVGYARDEVYRFGIVFFDDKGRASFVKWIGDIRMPSISTRNNVDMYIPDNGVPTYEEGRIHTLKVDIGATLEYKVIVDNDPAKSASRIVDTTLIETEAEAFQMQIDMVALAAGETGVLHIDDADFDLHNIDYTCMELGDHTITFELWNGHYSGQTWVRDGEIFGEALNLYLTNTQTVEYVAVEGTKRDFSPAFYSVPEGKTKANILYPEFTVSLSGTDAEGMSYQIVRVRRDSNDRSIRGLGMVTGTYAFDSFRYPQSWDSGVWSNDVVCFNSPEVCFNKNLDKQAGDRLKIIGTYSDTIADTTGDIYKRRYKGISALANPQKPIVPLAEGVASNEHINEHTSTIRYGSVVTMDNNLEVVIGNYIYKRQMRILAADPKCDKGTNFACLLENTTNWTGYDKNADARQLIAYKRNVFLYQYGGPSYSARTRSMYIPTGRVQKSDTAVIPAFDGDTYIGMFDYLNAGWLEGATGARSEVTIFPVETSINLDLRMDACYHNTVGTPNGTNVKLMRESKGIWYDGTLPTPLDFVQTTDMYLYNTVYSKENTSKIYVSRPYDWVEEKSFDTRILASSVKTNNELSDNWLKFGANSYIDVDPQYGELTALINYNNQLLFFQPKAFGTISVNEKALIQTNTGSQLSLGTSGILSRFDYAKTEIGTSHRDHILLTPNGLYWLDLVNKSMIKFTGGPEELSLMKGMSSWFRTKFSGSITPSRVLLYYDPLYKEVNLVDSVQNFNLVYSEITDAFVSFYTFYPRLVINYNDKLLSSSDKLSFYKHNDSAVAPCLFYGSGSKSPSSITFIINPAESKSCLFTNLEWSTEVYDNTDNKHTETFTSLRISNDYQDTNTVTLTNNVNVKRRIRRWRHTIGRAKLDETGAAIDRLDARIRDTYIKLKLEFNNTNTRRFVTHDLTTMFMLPNK